MSRSTLVKANWYVMKQDDKVVIQSNERMAEKIGKMSKGLHTELTGENIDTDTNTDTDIDGFSAGIEMEQVDALLADEENESAVIKKEPEPAYQGPNPEELLANTQLEIESMYENAQQEIAALRENTVQAAMEEGRRQGYEDGMAQAQAEIAQAEADLKREYENKILAVETEYQKKLDEIEPDMIRMLSDIYEHVFAVELSGYRNVIMHLISTTLHRIDGNTNYIIRVSSEDFPFVSMQKQEVLARCVTPNATMEVVEDMTLAKNECLIETDTGIFDCSLGTELRELKKQLQLLSYEG